jgi:hypothetical protein
MAHVETVSEANESSDEDERDDDPHCRPQAQDTSDVEAFEIKLTSGLNFVHYEGGDEKSRKSEKDFNTDSAARHTWYRHVNGEDEEEKQSSDAIKGSQSHGIPPEVLAPLMLRF